MKFDTNKVIIDRDGKPLSEPVFEDGKQTEQTRLLTHGIVAVRAIDAQLPEDKELKAEDVRKRFSLGAKIMAGGLVDLTPSDASLIQTRVCVFGVVVAGQVIDALDHDASAKSASV